MSPDGKIEQILITHITTGHEQTSPLQEKIIELVENGKSIFL